MAIGTLFSRTQERARVALHWITVTSVIFSSLVPTSFIGTLPAHAEVTTLNAISVTGDAPQLLTASSVPTPVLGLDMVADPAEVLSTVTVTLNPSNGFSASSDLSPLSEALATSGIALYKDNKAGVVETRGVFDGSDTFETLAVPPMVTDGSRLSRLQPSNTMLTNDASIPLNNGDLLFTDVTANAAPTTGYAWHMATLPPEAEGSMMSALDLRFDGAGGAPTYRGGSTQVSHFTPEAVGSFVINNTEAVIPLDASVVTPTYSDPAVGDVVFYQTGTAAAQWGLVTNATKTSGTFAINGAALANGTYTISKIAGQTGSFALAPGQPIEVVGAYAAPQLGDIVLYRTSVGGPIATWGVVTNATMTAGIFSIGGAPIMGESFQITKVTAYAPLAPSTMTATTIPTGDQFLAYGDLILGMPTLFPATASYNWHIARIGTEAGVAALRLDSQAAPPVFGSSVMLATTGPSIPTDNVEGVNAGPDFFIVIRTSAGAVNGRAFSVGVVPGTFNIGGSYPPTMPTAIVSSTYTINTPPPPPEGPEVGPAISTPAIPGMIVGSVYGGGNPPLVTLAGVGGSESGYVFSIPATPVGNDTTFANLGLSLSEDGIITGTVENLPGSRMIKVQVTDDALATGERFFNFNVAPAGGAGIPGISSVSPPGVAQGTESFSVTITGVNTNFADLSTVEFLMPPGIEGESNITTTSVTRNSATSLTASITVAGGAALGMRDVRVATGAEVAILPNSFGVFASGSSGLTLLFPANSATGVQIPPSFQFNPSSEETINTYRITVNSAANFTGTTLWDYAFKKYNPANPSESHCNVNGCSVNYGAGQFLRIAAPTPLAPNTAYYWKVRTYTELPTSEATITGATAVESAPAESSRSFTTTESVTDTVPPAILHRPIQKATESAAFDVFAKVFDNIATTATSPALSTKLFYCSTADCTPTTEVNGTSVGAGFFKFTIPSGAVGTVAGNAVVRYFIRASDGTNTNNFKAPGDAPFQVSVQATGTKSITGTIRTGDDTDTCSASVQGTVVFAEGTGFNTVASSNNQCSFTLANLPDGIYDVVVFKEGFGDRINNGRPAAAVPTAIAFRLSSGFVGGFGGDSAKPRVRFNGPPENGMAPGNDSNFRIFVAFDKTMSQNSVTAAGNLTVNEVDIATGVLTNVTSKGSWAYYSTAPNVPGIPPEANIAVWSFSQSGCSGLPCTFGDNKTIAVKVNDVTDSSGNAIQGNQSDGSYSFSFSTHSSANFIDFDTNTGQFAGGQMFGQGEMIPPRVNGTNPTPGSVDVSRNTRVLINFSDPMADDSDSYTLLSKIKLFTVTNDGTETDVSSAALDTIALETSKMAAKITLKSSYNSGLYAANTKYRLKVLGGAKGANSLTLAPPGQESNVMFMSSFKTGATSDMAAPNVLGTFPDSGATNVPVNLGAISIGFGKDLDPSTLTTSSVKLSVGSTDVTGTVEYKPLERQVLFMPKNALTANTTYTLSATTDVRGINGTALSAALSRTFTTGAADTIAPSVSFVNADDFNLAITFSEPMNAAKAVDSSNFGLSVLKPGNYVLKYGVAGFDAAAAGTVIAIPASASFTYDAGTSTVAIKGYHDSDITAATLQGKDIHITITGVNDLSGNAIATADAVNTARTLLKDSSLTMGALGPMAVSGDAFTRDRMAENFSKDTFGFAPPVEVRPFNTMAGQTTIYGVNIPLSKQIPAGGTIVLSFPTGFDVSGAKQDVNSPKRSDLNGPGTGLIKFKCNTSSAGGKTCSGDATITGDAEGNASVGGLADDGVTVNAAARTVTITISAATRSENSDTHDFLAIDIAGIKNSTVPKDYNTAGYSVDVKTMNGVDQKETLTSMPFFIQTAGAYSLTGTITAVGANAGTAKVYLMSPMTGPVETTSGVFAGGSATYTFTNLPSGDFMLFTDQFVSLGGTEFAGKTMPERVMINEASDTAGGGADDDSIPYSFSLATQSGGTNVTVTVTGPANEPLDVFANSSTGFRVKQVTLDGAGNGSAVLNLSVGQWNVGVGPQMPKGPAGGPPPETNYLPPQPTRVFVTGADSCTIDNVEACALTVALTTSDKTIKGTITDAAGLPMANAEVFAYSPLGGFGTHTQTDSLGVFTLNVTDGSFILGSFVPGMPPSKEVPIIVNSDPTRGGHATNYLFIDGATTGVAPATAITSFILKVAKPGYTISGKITDGTNVVQGASVYAYRTNGPGHANVNTDSSGNYTLYVSSGTWSIGSFLPNYGNLTEQTVTIGGSDATNINFSPSQTGTFYTVSGTVMKAGEAVQGVFVRIKGNNTFNETITGADGAYSFKVPAGNGYRIRGFVPGIGELPPLADFNVSADVENKNIVLGATSTITFALSSVVKQAFIEAISVEGQSSRIEIKNKNSGTMSLPNGNYSIRITIPGVSKSALTITATTEATSYTSGTTTLIVNSNEGLTIVLPTVRTITGTVTDGTDPIGDAWVELVDSANGIFFGTKTATDGTFNAVNTPDNSLKVADGSYLITVMKPGYYRDATSLQVNAETGAQALVMAVASRTISGQIFIGETGAASAFVRAEKIGGGFSGTQADANGMYSLPVSAGQWKIFAVAEGYAEVGLSTNPVDTTSESATGKNITVTTPVSLTAPKSKPITPASGGTLEDSTAGITIMVPANALGTSTSSGNITARETNNVRETGNAVPLSGKAKEIKATDSSGNPITTLNDSVTVEMSYSIAELGETRSAADSSINTKTEADKLAMGYWDETTSNWVTMPTSVLYLDENDALVANPSEDLSDVAKVKFSAATNHFSLYAPIVKTSAQAPDAPADLAAGSATTTTLVLTWTQVVGATGYSIFRSTTSGGTYTRLGSDPTVSSGSTVTYADSGLSASTTYYYKISALNAEGESVASSAISGVTSAVASSSGSSGGGSVAMIPAAPTPTPSTAAEPAASSGSESAEKLITFTFEAPKETKTTSVPQAANGSSVSAQPAAKQKTELAPNLMEIKGLANTKAELTTVENVLKATVAPKLKVDGTLNTATTKAIKDFQIKYGIAKKGQAGFGTLGPKTRAKINELIKAAKTSPSLKPTASAKPAAKQKTELAPNLAEIKGLANTKAELTTVEEVLKSTVAPKLKVDGKMDSSVTKAVKDFQIKYGIAKKGQAGFGTLGPKTRAKINAMR